MVTKAILDTSCPPYSFLNGVRGFPHCLMNMILRAKAALHCSLLQYQGLALGYQAGLCSSLFSAAIVKHLLRKRRSVWLGIPSCGPSSRTVRAGTQSISREGHRKAKCPCHLLCFQLSPVTHEVVLPTFRVGLCPFINNQHNYFHSNMPLDQPDLGNFSVETLFQMFLDLRLTFTVGKCSAQAMSLACQLGGFGTWIYGDGHWRALKSLNCSMPIFNDHDYNSE